MRNTAFLLLFIFTSLIASAQVNTTEFSTGKEGLEYKIIPTGDGTDIQYGSFLQLHFSSLCNNGFADSLLSDSRKSGSPVIEALDSTTVPAAYFDILKRLKKGDSLVIRILMDSLYKSNPAQMPPFFKKGGHLITTLKIINVFGSKAQADSARMAIMNEKTKADSIHAIAQVAEDDRILNDFFAKNAIHPLKAPKGTYINIIKKGEGKNVTTSNKVKVNYTGKTLAGKVFDSNTDPAFNHVEPFEVDLSAKGTVITGWEEGLLFLNKGAKAVLYIPSTLAYGANGAGGDIGPNEVLIFDVEIVSVENASAPAVMGIPEAKPATKPAAKPVKKPAAKKSSTATKPKPKTAGKK